MKQSPKLFLSGAVDRLITEAGADESRTTYPVVVGWNEIFLASDFFQGNGLDVVTASGDHHSIRLFMEQPGAGGAQSRGQQSVAGRGRAPSLQVSQDGQPRFHTCPFFQFRGQPQRVIDVLFVERRQLRGGLPFVRFCLCRFLAFD